MITPTQWVPFADAEAKLEYLKERKLVGKMARECGPLCYCGHYSGYAPQLCEAVGYVDAQTLVVQIGESLHAVHPEYLAEMRVGRSEWLKAHTGSKSPAADADLPLLPPDFVVFDIETTGLERTSEIIDIAAVRVVNGTRQEAFHSLVNPCGELPAEIIELTGITPLDLMTAPTIEDVMPKFLDYIGDAVVVGQNIRNFDLPICNHWTAQLGLPAIENETMDTLTMAREKLKLRSYALPALAKALEVTVESSHQALADTETTLQCFLKLLQIPDKK